MSLSRFFEVGEDDTDDESGFYTFSEGDDESG
jgi:hypothetical protein